MIDGIGKAGAGRIDSIRGSIERSAPVGRSADSLSQPQVGGAGSAAAELAAGGAPVDAGKVTAIRTAIAEGRYPVDPDKIAEAMIALDLPKAKS